VREEEGMGGEEKRTEEGERMRKDERGGRNEEKESGRGQGKVKWRKEREGEGTTGRNDREETVHLAEQKS